MATGFSSVDSLIRHVRKSCIRTHNGNRRLLSTVKETIEICSHVVPGQEDEELTEQDVEPDRNHSITNPPFFIELQQCESSSPNKGALRSNEEKLDTEKENLVSKDEDDASDIQKLGLANMVKTIPLTERKPQEFCAREREKTTMGRISEG